MIQRFVIGKPFPTESVVLDLPAETGPVPYLTPDGDGWQYVMQEKDIVYGLGEMPRGLNKRGWHYETNNTDESEHGENRLSYYAAHNFLLISPADDSGCIGIFVDFPGKVSYDIGYTRHDTLRFATAEPNYALYLITALQRQRSQRSSGSSSAPAISRPSGRSVWPRAASAIRPRPTSGRWPRSTRPTACRWT